MSYPFFTALPGIEKFINRLKTTKEKLDYLGWIRKEMKNMILEFQRLSPEWMYKISRERFSSRNKHLDSFIKVGVKAMTYESKLNEQNLYDYVKRQIEIRDKIVLNQISNEIEYYEKVYKIGEKEDSDHLAESLISNEKEKKDLLEKLRKEEKILFDKIEEGIRLKLNKALKKPNSVDEVRYSQKINFTNEANEFVERMIRTKELDINNYLFVSKAKNKLFADLSQRGINLSQRNKESIRTYLSKLKSEYIRKNNRSKRKKK